MNNERAARIFLYIMIVLLIIYAVCSYAKAYEQTSLLGISSFVVLTLTLMTLVIYAWDTHRIANQQEKTFLTPIVSHAFNLPAWWGVDCEVFLTLSNKSAYDVKTLVTLNIYVDDQKLIYSDESHNMAYQGQSYWIMCPIEGRYDGHFRFGKEFLAFNDINWTSYNETEFNKHNVVFELLYETNHDLSNETYKSMTYKYKFFIMTHIGTSDYKGNPLKFAHFVPLVEKV